MIVRVTHACGHETSYDMYGPRAQRERKAWALGQSVCPECEARKVAEWEEARGLPPIEGTPRQAAWAARIRMEACEEAERRRPPEDADAAYHEAVRQLPLCTNAEWWINNRHASHVGLLWLELNAAAREADSLEAAALAVMAREDGKDGPLCRVTLEDGVLVLGSDYDRGIPPVAKSLGLRWDGSRWRRRLPEWAGDAADRAAELCAALLDEGYPVLADDAVREKVEAGTWERECLRWVLCDRDNPGNVVLLWEKDNQDMRLAACRVPGSTVHDRSATVPATEAAAVEDFAALHGLRITQEARERMDGASVVKVINRGPAPAPDGAEEALRAILESPRDVLADLLEEDD